jgi:hypothetical protein
MILHIRNRLNGRRTEYREPIILSHESLSNYARRLDFCSPGMRYDVLASPGFRKKLAVWACRERTLRFLILKALMNKQTKLMGLCACLALAVVTAYATQAKNGDIKRVPSVMQSQPDCTPTPSPTPPGE